MTDIGLKMLSGQTSCDLGVQLGIAAGPHGREHEAGVNAGNKGAGVTYAYTFEKGCMINVGYNDYAVDAATAVNLNFYGKNAESVDIVMTPGTVEVPTGKGVEEMHNKLAALSK
jgi:lipid-binding SYLF domain-containing protein